MSIDKRETAVHVQMLPSNRQTVIIMQTKFESSDSITGRNRSFVTFKCVNFPTMLALLCSLAHIDFLDVDVLSVACVLARPYAAKGGGGGPTFSELFFFFYNQILNFQIVK